MTWAWNKFTKNYAALIIPIVVYLISLVAVLCIPIVLVTLGGDTTSDNAATPTTANTAIGAVFVTILSAVFLALIMVMHAGVISGSLDLADGKPVSVTSFLKPRNFGRLVATLLLVGLLWLAGTLLCVVPGIVVGFASQFAFFFAIDRAVPPVDAIKASFATVKNNLGNVLLSLLIQYAVALVGMLICYVGLIAALPIVALLQAYTYRKLTGGQVAALTP